MQLRSSPSSPFGRKVKMATYIFGFDTQVTPVLTDTLDHKDSICEVNPLGKIPALERSDGPAIYDSRVITQYLAAQSEYDFYPEVRIWEVLTLEATADGMMEAAVLMVYEGRTRPKNKQFPDWVEAQWSKVDRSLNTLEERWIGHLVGPLDAAQIAVGCALEYLDFRHESRDWRSGRPQLAAWQANFAKRESMSSTVPENL